MNIYHGGEDDGRRDGSRPFDSGNSNSGKEDGGNTSGNDSGRGNSSGPSSFWDKAGWRPAGGGAGAPFGKKPVPPFEKKPKNNSTRRSILSGIGIAIAVVVIFVIWNSFYRVDEQETAVVTMFGNVVRTDTAGLYFKIPLIQNVQKVDTTIHGTGIGYVVSGDGQNFTVDTEGIMITSDFNLIDIDFYMEYRVSDPVAYLYSAKQPELILKNIALAAIRSTVIDFTVDDAMTTGKTQIQSEVKAKMQEMLTEQNIGIQVVNITVQDAEPPNQEIVSAFKAVETAKQGKDTAINNANKYRNEQIPAAEAKADQIIQKAEAGKQARIAEAEGQAARFNAIYEEYSNNPLITKERLFYETLEEVLPDAKIVIDDGGTETLLPLDSFVPDLLTGAGSDTAGTRSGSQSGSRGQ